MGPLWFFYEPAPKIYKEFLMRKQFFLFVARFSTALLAAILVVLVSCDTGTSATKLSECAITAFVLPDVLADIAGDIDEERHDIILVAPSSVTALKPTVIISSKATVSPASGVATDFTNPVTYTVTAENGTTQTYTVTVVRETTSVLPNAVWSLETTPKMGWTSLTFKARGRVIVSGIPDDPAEHSTNNYWYSYDSTAKTGKIFSHNWAPGAFSYNDSTKVLTFADWGGHGTFNYEFPQRRASSGDASIAAPNLLQIYNGTFPGALVGTIWAGENPMGAWVTLAFKADNKVVASFTHDNTTNLYTFAWDQGKAAATFSDPAPGTFVDASYMSFYKPVNNGSKDEMHLKIMTSEKTFKRYK